jgi:hypothetical protein
VRLSHDPLLISASFDDPNLVSRAGLFPVMSLAERAGLHALVRRNVQITAKNGVHPELKVACLVAGMAAGADSINDLDLLRHGAMTDLFGGVRAPSTLGSFLRSFTWGNVRQLGAAAASCWRSWPARRRCCPARVSWRSQASTRCSGGSTGTRNKAPRSDPPRFRASQCWSAG